MSESYASSLMEALFTSMTDDQLARRLSAFAGSTDRVDPHALAALLREAARRLSAKATS